MQCDFPRTNQWCFLLPHSFTEYQLGLRLEQRWEFATQFPCLKAEATMAVPPAGVSLGPGPSANPPSHLHYHHPTHHNHQVSSRWSRRPCRSASPIGNLPRHPLFQALHLHPVHYTVKNNIEFHYSWATPTMMSFHLYHHSPPQAETRRWIARPLSPHGVSHPHHRRVSQVVAPCWWYYLVIILVSLRRW